MITKLSNDLISITVKHKGAELCSLVDCESGQEYIWQGDPTYWGRHAPVLFPIVGKLKDNRYTYQGKAYTLPQHGFARDMKFQLVEEHSNELVFLLKWCDETLPKYPFRFELKLSYRLENRTVTTAYQVRNVGEELLCFSIGGHPAFNCPLQGHKKRSDYTLYFSQKENASKHLLEQGAFSGETSLILEDTDKLPITDSLFQEDALVFKGLKSEFVDLHDGQKSVLRFHFYNFPYLGIWSKNEESPFICIEPWYGLADNINHNQDITAKEGIQILEEKQTFDCAYTVELI